MLYDLYTVTTYRNTWFSVFALTKIPKKEEDLMQVCFELIAFQILRHIDQNLLYATLSNLKLSFNIIISVCCRVLIKVHCE